MAYDEALSHRFRQKLDGMVGISEKRMMGGLCFLLNGNMIGGAHREKTGQGRFLFRVGKINDGAAQFLHGGEQLIQGGRKMGGFYLLDADDCEDKDFNEWLSLALSFVSELPPK